jgi:uroporphyrinogen-III synthase
LCHVSGAYSAGDLAGLLDGSGVTLGRVVAYRQEVKALGEEAIRVLNRPGEVILPLFSPRTSGALMGSVHEDFASSRIAVCLSRSVAGQLDSERFDQIVVAAKPRAEAMINAICNLIG